MINDGLKLKVEFFINNARIERFDSSVSAECGPRLSHPAILRLATASHRVSRPWWARARGVCCVMAWSP